MVVYCKIDANFESCTSIKAKISKIDAIIASLMDVALKSVLNGNTIEYTLDTGQTKINKIFSSTTSVTSAIQEYEKIRQMYVNKITPRIVRLVDGKNFIQRRNGR